MKRLAALCFGLAACHTHYKIVEDFELGEGGGCATLADKSRWCWGTEQAAHSQKPLPQAQGGAPPVGQVGASRASNQTEDRAARFTLVGTELCDRGKDCETLAAPPVSFAGSPHHACVVDAAGTVSCRGESDHGRLGAGVTGLVAKLRRVPGVDGAKSVALGDDFGCALLKNVTVTCWGSNEKHALAQGEAIVYDTPMPVVGLFAVTGLKAQADQACASLTDGGLRCWGSARAGGSMGRAGGSSNNVPMPVQFP